MSKIIHVYFGDHKKHPIVNNYIKTSIYEFEVIDAPKTEGSRLQRFLLMAKLLFRINRRNNYIFHAHDLLSFYLVKCVFPVSPILFDSHEVYRGYFKGISYPFIYVLEEFSTLLASYKFLPSLERSKLYFFKKNIFILENLFLPQSDVSLKSAFKQKKSFVYAGLLSDKRCIKELIFFFEKNSNFTLTIYGQKNIFFKKILSLGLPKNVTYGGEVTQKELFEILPEFIASFALYKPTDLNNKYPAPTKIFENEFYGLTTIVFKSDYVDRLIELEVLKNTYTIDSLNKNDVQKILSNDELGLSKPNSSQSILWVSQEQLISKIYESMALRNA